MQHIMLKGILNFWPHLIFIVFAIVSAGFKVMCWQEEGVRTAADFVARIPWGVS